jgi:hypothetical protein
VEQKNSHNLQIKITVPFPASYYTQYKCLRTSQKVSYLSLPRSKLVFEPIFDYVLHLNARGEHMVAKLSEL